MTDESKDELESRVEQLEDQLQSQQETLQKILPNRRQALKGLGLVAGGGILGGLGGSASASTGTAGQIGTGGDRPDVNADAVDLLTLNTADIENASSGTVPTSQGDGTLSMASVGGSEPNTVSTPTAYTSGPSHGKGTRAFSGAVLSPGGRVIFAPNGSSNVGIFDPVGDSYTSGPSHVEGDFPFHGAVLSPDGRVILAPYDSDSVGTTAFNLGIATAKLGSF